MGTILVYRNDGFCEIALDSGERIQMHFDKTGLVIERQQTDAQPAEVLFKGDTALVSSMCVSLIDRDTKVSPLNLLASVVQQMPSAGDVRSAFAAAARAV